MDDLTIVYYSSNREKPIFEHNVTCTLLDAIGDLPLISVTQKPMVLGKNICVGDIGATPDNVLLQMMLGAKEADTKYIGFGQSDTLYHKSHFEFRPKEDDVFYYPDNAYLLWVGNRKFRFWRKKWTELATITNREHFIKVIGEVMNKGLKAYRRTIGKLTKQETFHVDIPVVSIKTREGMHFSSPYIKQFERILPYWGSGPEVLRKYEYKAKE